MSTPYEPYPTPPPEPPRGPVPLSQPQREASLPDAYGRFWKKYADFTGRASRSEFWWVFLVNAVIGAVLNIIGRSVGGVQWLSYLWELAVVVPQFALGARRLHDTGRSGWWQLLVITCVGYIVLIVWWATPPTPRGAKYDVAYR